MFAKLYSLIFITLLVGCANSPQRVVVETNTIKPIVIPAHLLKGCQVTKPPLPATYVKLMYKDKENVLTNYTIDLLRELKICNDQIKDIEEFQTNQLKLIATQNKEK